ncbi:MAG: riboflavin synthase [Gammaproteobacteria bacterium]|nr:riboflavin synthase [Gammaproteobacteria bacterium]
MFTGIIEATGKIEAIESRRGDKRFTIDTGKLDISDVAIGDSIACNGVCLTVIELTEKAYVADVSAETLKLTTLADINIKSPVNLEKALTPTTRLGGHLVSGHVDGQGKIVSIETSARSTVYKIEAPEDLARYIAKKGSITVDGISLTVNEVEGAIFDLNLVPHTLQETIASDYKVGDKVNLEVDIIARYLERLLLGQSTADDKNTQKPIDYALLVNSGFLKSSADLKK